MQMQTQTNWRTTKFGMNSERGDPVDKSQLFTKTVTNFAQVRFDNNGGLNPVSPVKRGLSLDVHTENRSSMPSDWKRTGSVVKAAMPSMELDISERAVSVF